MLVVSGKQCLCLVGPLDSNFFQAEKYFGVFLEILGNLHCAYTAKGCGIIYAHGKKNHIFNSVLILLD